MVHTIKRIARIVNRTIGSIIGSIIGIIKKNTNAIFFLRRFNRNAPKVQNCFITCSGKRDGIGAQVQAVLSTMLFAQEFRLTYIHTPFRSIAHGESVKNWEAECETFFNLGKDEITIDEIEVNSLRVVHIDNLASSLIIKFIKPNTLYVVSYCHYFADIYPNYYSSITDRFINKYRASQKTTYKSFYEAGKINIAVHIRRGDVSQKKATKKRYTDNLYYESLLRSITTILGELNTDVSIHLYSQGLIEDFHELKEIDINYHLDECIFTTFYNLTSADIMIMAKSSYSYSAALLSDGIKFYEPFWHKPLDDWIVTSWSHKNQKAVFNELNLKQRLRSLLA